ncbi:hypothetical protein E4H12_13645 [Candidatus Thorarchaeota archaeon]|nr:MAG: hypothetical protein E4H12_13645 [Candidatus Thorarchaeota archaeon]
MLSFVKQLKYPFSQEARQTSQKYARDLGALADLLDLQENFFIIEAAEQRVYSALTHDEVRLPQVRDEKEVLIYSTARLIVEEIASPQLRARQAEAESKSINKQLAHEDDQFVIDLCKSSFGWEVESMGDLHERAKLPSQIKSYDMKIRFENFLEVAPDFHAEEWKLVNRYVDNGWTLIRRRELNRLVSGRFRQIVLLGRLDIPRLPERLAEVIERIETEMKKYIRHVEPFKIDGQVNSAFPPCIQKMYDDSIGGNVNLSHDARFALAAFLLKIGMSREDVNEVFDHSPDRKDSLIDYQVRSIAEKKSTSEVQGYFPTGCKKLQTNNLCPVSTGETFDPLCEYILNPLGFYSTRAWEISNNVANHSWYAEKKDKKQTF